MSNRLAAVLAVSIWLGTPEAGSAQQRFRLFGGAGFAALNNPEVNHGRTAIVGGGIGFRFNDNLSLETGVSFARSNRQFDQDGVPVEEVQALPAFRYEANRYHLDATLLLHLGRRQPFHPFVSGGGGLVRRDERRIDLSFTLDENNAIIDSSEQLVLDTTEYETEAHFGAGFDLYFLYNLAARIEFRLWLPQDRDLRTRAFLFGASYYF